jgi:hypothetical protein
LASICTWKFRNPGNLETLDYPGNLETLPKSKILAKTLIVIRGECEI